MTKIKAQLKKLGLVLKNAIWKIRIFFQKIKEKIGNIGFIKAIREKVKLPTFARALLYLSPALILLAIFTFYPIINSFILVIYKGYNQADGTIDGYTLFGNFLTVLRTEGFIRPMTGTSSSVLINTFLLAIITVPISVILSLLIAVALNSIKPLKGFFQTIFFLPYVTNTIAIGLVFSYMFSGNQGLVNKLLSMFGVDAISWVDRGASYWAALSVMLIYTIWDSLAFKIMVFLSAIQGIDKQYYQAADIDATPKSRVFRKITVPLLSPMIFYIVITSVIGAFKAYSSVVAVFGDTARPPGATYNLKTIVFYIYDYLNNAVPGNLSLAASASIILFAIILFFTLIQMYVGKKRVHY